MTEPKTIIGPNTAVSGTIEGDEILVVEGRIEGSISLSKALVVEPGGMVQANVSVESAVIRGALQGNIQATDMVSVETGGRVVGDIVAPRVVLSDGAAFRGGIDMGEFDLEALPEVGAQPEAAPVPQPQVAAPRPQITAPPPPAAMPPQQMSASPPRFVEQASPARRSAPPAERPEPRVSKRPLPRSRVSMQSPDAIDPPARAMAPMPRMRAVGRTKAKKKGV